MSYKNDVWAIENRKYIKVREAGSCKVQGKPPAKYICPEYVNGHMEMFHCAR